MIYKVYINNKKNGEYEVDDLFFLLDELILKNNIKENIIVVEHDNCTNSDNVFYLYFGDAKNYINFSNFYRKNSKKSNTKSKILL